MEGISLNYPFFDQFFFPTHEGKMLVFENAKVF
jgi:hypothetical protein